MIPEKVQAVLDRLKEPQVVEAIKPLGSQFWPQLVKVSQEEYDAVIGMNFLGPFQVFGIFCAHLSGTESRFGKEFLLEFEFSKPFHLVDAKGDDGALCYVAQWQERVGWKLFPSKLVDIPEMPGARDGLITETRVGLSWLDRLRVLISGKLVVTLKTATQNVIGEHKTASGVSVRPPAWLDRRESKGGAK